MHTRDEMKIVESDKDEECSECHRKIPIGHRHWLNCEWMGDDAMKTHTNCELYTGREFELDEDD